MEWASTVPSVLLNPKSILSFVIMISSKQSHVLGNIEAEGTDELVLSLVETAISSFECCGHGEGEGQVAVLPRKAKEVSCSY
jgi:hypothetical protein